jgi:hypothetical protein
VVVLARDLVKRDPDSIWSRFFCLVTMEWIGMRLADRDKVYGFL